MEIVRTSYRRQTYFVRLLLIFNPFLPPVFVAINKWLVATKYNDKLALEVYEKSLMMRLTQALKFNTL